MPRKLKGFTLVELMISLLAGSILVGLIYLSLSYLLNRQGIGEPTFEKLDRVNQVNYLYQKGLIHGMDSLASQAIREGFEVVFPNPLDSSRIYLVDTLDQDTFPVYLKQNPLHAD